MGETLGRARETVLGADTKPGSRRREILNWISCLILLLFYAGTWTFPWFYHITEIYNTSIVFAALLLLFLNNVPWPRLLKQKDPLLLCLIAAGALALLNLFLIGSNKGCILILADFLLIFYIAPFLDLTGSQRTCMEVFFLLMFLSWFLYDRAFSYNSNTGATVTVFTFFGAMVLLSRLTEGREIRGFWIVISVIRVVTLVLWHLARGAFAALFFFLFFYYVVPASWWGKRRPYRFLVFFATLGSLLFVVFYVWAGSTGFNLKLPFFYKNIFSGREKIWYEVWEMLRLHLLTGIGSGYALKSFFEYNIHNSMYDILAVHGVPVFLLSLCLLWGRLFPMQELVARGGREKRAAASALFAIFLESFIDMDLMWADYSPLLLFLLLTIYRPDPAEGGPGPGMPPGVTGNGAAL